MRHTFTLWLCALQTLKEFFLEIDETNVATLTISIVAITMQVVNNEFISVSNDFMQVSQDTISILI